MELSHLTFILSSTYHFSSKMFVLFSETNNANQEYIMTDDNFNAENHLLGSLDCLAGYCTSSLGLDNVHGYVDCQSGHLDGLFSYLNCPSACLDIFSGCLNWLRGDLDNLFDYLALGMSVIRLVVYRHSFWNI